MQDTVLPLKASEEFSPDPEQLEAALRDLPATTRALVIVNAQHNPTGINWPESVVSRIVGIVHRYRAALLIDDAYFAMCDDGVIASSALMALRRLGESGGGPYLMTRSLGKQCGCNGFGVGFFVGPRQIVDDIVHRIRPRRVLNAGARYQWGLARWLEDGGAAVHAASLRVRQRRRRSEVQQLLQSELSLDPASIPRSSCTPFALFAVPPTYADCSLPVEQFRIDCAERAGVFFSSLWPSAGATLHRANERHVRLYLLRDEELLRQGLARVGAMLRQRSGRTAATLNAEGGAGANSK
jgi:N-succinyldiaminopimelate aminotransferase